MLSPVLLLRSGGVKLFQQALYLKSLYRYMINILLINVLSEDHISVKPGNRLLSLKDFQENAQSLFPVWGYVKGGSQGLTLVPTQIFHL